MDTMISRSMSLSSPTGPPAHSSTTAHEPNRIVSFPEAISALKQHSFRNKSLNAATSSAHDLYERTFETINTEQLFSLLNIKEHLNPSDHYLAYVSVFHGILSQVEPAAPIVPQLLQEYRVLVSSTPAQFVHALPQRWVGLNRHAARLAIDADDVPRALSLIRPLREAAEKLAPAPHFLVPTQADFLATCLQAKCYRLAARWIRQHRRLQLDVNKTAITASDVHLIYHYSALVFIGVKDYRAALQSCRLALSVPAPAPGSFFNVAVATYKVFILLHLLVTGKSPPPLKFSSYQSSRMRKVASEYVELAHAYENNDREQTRKILESNRDHFDKQSHLGLVKQVSNALTKQLIVRLTNSFVTMKMEDVASRAGLSSPQEAQTVILEMIQHDKIHASIDDRKGVVHLMDNDVKENGSLPPNISNSYMNDCLSILQRIEVFREKLKSDPVYVMKELTAQQNRRSSGNSGGASASKSAGGLGTIEAEFFSYGDNI